MNYDGTPYGDLIDSTPVIGTADRLVSRCRDAARSADRGRYSTADLHDWAIERYEAHDELVRMTMNALFARDCVWGVADLDNPGLDRYAWELAVEIGFRGSEPMRDRFRGNGWLYPVGEFASCGDLYEVLLEWHGATFRRPAHLLVRKIHVPPIPGVHLGLFEPVYLPDGVRHRQFDECHREDFAAFMEGPAEDREGLTHWQKAVAVWNALDADSKTGTSERQSDAMPDYRQLHWPRELQTEGADGSC